MEHETASKAAEALYLLGLIERCAWWVNPVTEEHTWAVSSSPEHCHIAPTLIEALTAASRCPRCTNQQET